MPKQPAFTYEEAEREKISTEFIRNKLKLKSFELKNSLSKKHPHADNFFKAKNIDLGKIRAYSSKLISTSALAGTLLFNHPVDGTGVLQSSSEILGKLNPEAGSVFSEEGIQIDKKKLVLEALNNNLPKKPRPLVREEEKFMEQVFSHTMDIPVKATLEGEHLNTTYGYIGAEQHLRRFPGDNISLHGDSPQIKKEGMAPGLGAWGYFANSKNDMSQNLVEIEKWYVVVQTLYLPDWNTRQPYIKDWYKYRKVVVVNTVNGNAVVGAIADSGPAAWTGKHFGGSPEVMDYLGGPKYKKGSVIIFFVDDPENKIPLGPITY